MNPEYHEGQKVEAMPKGRWRKGEVTEIEELGGPSEHEPDCPYFLYYVEFKNGDIYSFEDGDGMRALREGEAA
jgi:hypothetical protein